VTQTRHSYVRFYPSDWLAGVGFMPPMWEWVYLQVCLYNWDQGEPMPKGQVAMRLARNPNWEADLAGLVEAGKIMRDHGGKLSVPRALAEAKRAGRLRDSKVQAGKAGAEKTNAISAFNGTADGKPSANQNQNQNQTSPIGEDPPIPPAGDLLFQPPEAEWAEWVQHRIEIGHPMTKGAEAKQLKALEAYVAEGHSAVSVINYSIAMGYRGLFPRKDAQRGPNRTISNDGFFDASFARANDADS
jgi:hypothetical protein